MVINKLGRMLVAANLLNEQQIEKAIALQQKEGGRIGSILVRLGYIEENTLLEFLSKQYGIKSLDLNKVEIDSTIIKLIPTEVVQKYTVIPVRRVGSVLTIAMLDPSNIFAIDDIKFMTGYDVDVVVATETAIKATMAKYYDTSALNLQQVLKSMDVTDEGLDILSEKDAEEQVDLRELKEALEEAPVVKLVNLILTDAIKKGSSDIHIEAYEKKFRVRYRVDGILYEVMNPPLKLRAALTSRLKIMAELDIAERRLPQDGRIKLKIKDREIDLRVSTLPCLFGEKVVLRILDKGSLSFDLTKLGFEQKSLEDLTKAIHSPYGMVLVTGPTGSGKSTTLYSALQQINEIGINIMTAEDPVEYNLVGVNQVQMKEEIGLNFAVALRSFLRQDPDVVLVGEIRDYETAEIAVKAALTGHLVLSTLHTNDAPSTITRLLNMGIEPFLVASSVILIIAQRLVRRICKECKEEDKVPHSVLTDLGFSEQEANSVVCYKGKGCPNCNDTGYRGRIALYEVMYIGEEIRELILEGASAVEIKKKAVANGMKNLRMAGLTKLKDGMTSVEEILRSTFG
ncbi:MAG: type II secretion system protein GspE [Nitrospirae bacterium RIFCSPLOWO2_02_42_7]|nr:MAG: type II secretion system protein GspE [Nitrospirae bacterium RIFCSPLOWO2_02_42_7]